MEYLAVEYLVWAITLGGINALSLPLGSWVGLQANPRPRNPYTPLDDLRCGIL